MAEPIKLPTRAPALPPTALKTATYERAHYFCVVSNETTLEQILMPSYWAHHASVIGAKRFAVIEVMREDGSLEVWLRATAAKAGMVTVRPVFPAIVIGVDGKRIAATKAMQAADTAVEMPPGYKWAHTPNGASPGHMVRLPNGEVLMKGEPTKASCGAKAWAHYRESMGLAAGTGPLNDEEAKALAERLRAAG